MTEMWVISSAPSALAGLKQIHSKTKMAAEARLNKL
jgi:hypothetical protein